MTSHWCAELLEVIYNCLCEDDENNLHDIDDRNGENSNCSAEHGEGSSAMDSLRQLPKLSSLPVRQSTVHF